MNDKIKNIMDRTIMDEILLILLGFALLIWPNATLSLVFRVVGIVILIMGIIRTAGYVKNKNEVRTKDLIIGIIELILGLILIIAPSVFITIGPLCAAVLIGYYAIVSLVKGINTLRAGIKGGIAAVVISAIALILAIIILFHPVSFASFLMRLIGIALIIAGISMVVASYENRKI